MKVEITFYLFYLITHIQMQSNQGIQARIKFTGEKMGNSKYIGITPEGVILLEAEY